MEIEPKAGTKEEIKREAKKKKTAQSRKNSKKKACKTETRESRFVDCYVT